MYVYWADRNCWQNYHFMFDIMKCLRTQVKSQSNFWHSVNSEFMCSLSLRIFHFSLRFYFAFAPFHLFPFHKDSHDATFFITLCPLQAVCLQDYALLRIEAKKKKTTSIEFGRHAKRVMRCFTFLFLPPPLSRFSHEFLCVRASINIWYLFRECMGVQRSILLKIIIILPPEYLSLCDIELNILNEPAIRVKKIEEIVDKDPRPKEYSSKPSNEKMCFKFICVCTAKT